MQFVKEWEPGSLETGAMEDRALQTPWWGVAMAVGSAPETEERVAG